MKLQIGDTIYLKTKYGYEFKFKISHITEKYAFTEEKIKFKNEIKNGEVELSSKPNWSAEKYLLETPEIKKEYLKHNPIK